MSSTRTVPYMLHCIVMCQYSIRSYVVSTRFVVPLQHCTITRSRLHCGGELSAKTTPRTILKYLLSSEKGFVDDLIIPFVSVMSLYSCFLFHIKSFISLWACRAIRCWYFHSVEGTKRRNNGIMCLCSFRFLFGSRIRLSQGSSFPGSRTTPKG